MEKAEKTMIPFAIIIGSSLITSPYENQKTDPVPISKKLLIERSFVSLVFHARITWGRKAIVLKTVPVKPKIAARSMTLFYQTL